jgi:nitric oxide reductase subunit B
VVRAILPALRRRDEQRPILTLFLISSAATAGFYFAALGAGRTTNLAVAEYWRWWVVHLWVEGFFEVFATVVISFLFARLKLLSLRTAGEATVLSTTIILAGGVIGTLLFVSVAFWNLVGAGLFGFMSNPPIWAWWCSACCRWG